MNEAETVKAVKTAVELGDWRLARSLITDGGLHKKYIVEDIIFARVLNEYTVIHQTNHIALYRRND